jgi:hypothetical protein
MATFNNKELWQIKKIRIGGQVVFVKVLRTGDTPGALIGEDAEDLAICVHGHAIRNPQELGGRCTIGGELLCSECAKVYRCEIDQNVTICRNHSFEDHGKRICSTHSFFQKLTFSFRK